MAFPLDRLLASTAGTTRVLGMASPDRMASLLLPPTASRLRITPGVLREAGMGSPNTRPARAILRRPVMGSSSIVDTDLLAERLLPAATRPRERTVKALRRRPDTRH